MIAKYIFSVGLLCSSFNLYGQQHIEILEKIKYEVEQQSEAYRQLEYATTSTVGFTYLVKGFGLFLELVKNVGIVLLLLGAQFVEVSLWLRHGCFSCS